MTNIFSYNHIQSWLKKGWATIPKLNYGPPRYRFIFYTSHIHDSIILWEIPYI